MCRPEDFPPYDGPSQDEDRDRALKAVYDAAVRQFLEVKEKVPLPDTDAFQDWYPLTTDLVTFVIWLRHNSDFFSGPDLDFHFPWEYDPVFTDVLADLALVYTGE